MKPATKETTAFWAGYISGQNGLGGDNPYAEKEKDLREEWFRGERSGDRRRQALAADAHALTGGAR